MKTTITNYKKIQNWWDEENFKGYTEISYTDISYENETLNIVFDADHEEDYKKIENKIKEITK